MNPVGETQVNATTPTTPRPKSKAQPKSNPQSTPAKVESKPPEAKKGGKGGGKGKRGKSEPQSRKEKAAVHSFLSRNMSEG